MMIATGAKTSKDLYCFDTTPFAHLPSKSYRFFLRFYATVCICGLTNFAHNLGCLLDVAFGVDLCYVRAGMAKNGLGGF